MKFNYLIKTTPFLSTLLLIIILTISNQKEYTKLRILIWNTPSLSLGTYLGISAGTGFIFSFLITNNLGKIFMATPKNSIKYKERITQNWDPKITDIWICLKNEETWTRRINRW